MDEPIARLRSRSASRTWCSTPSTSTRAVRFYGDVLGMWASDWSEHQKVFLRSTTLAKPISSDRSFPRSDGG